MAASLCANAVAGHHPFALVAGAAVLEPGEGAGHLERALDLLARVDFSVEEPVPAPPVPTDRCVLVGVHPRAGFGDALVVGSDAKPAPLDAGGPDASRDPGVARPPGAAA